MKKITTLLSLIMFIPAFTFAQFTFTNGSSSLELSGYIIGFYEYRPQFHGDPNAGNYSKNIFDLDDARFNIKGFVKGHFKFELEANFADIPVIATGGVSQIESDPLTEAYVEYINPIVNVKAGYFKVPFSESGYLDKVPSPFLHRTTIANGDYYFRRDAGVLLIKDAWHQRILAQAGIISGLGENVVLGNGDPSGKPAYIAKLQLQTAYYRDEEVDYKDLAVPLARVGGAVLYNVKGEASGPNGTNIYALDNVWTVDGKMIEYEAEAAFMWHGFSAQFEMDQAHIQPAAGTTLASQLSEYSTNYYRNGGFLVQANYYNKLLQSVFAVRYDLFVPTDLTSGDQQRTVAFAYNFLLLPYGLTLKIHYDYRLKQPNIDQKFKEDELRAGFQWVF